MFFILSFLTLLSSITFASNEENLSINKTQYVTNMIWKERPKVIICKSNNFSKENIEKAIEKWRSKGEAIKSIEYETDSNKCLVNGKKGYIQIMGKVKHLNKYKHYAVTYHKFLLNKNNQQQIISVNIETAGDTYNRYSTTLHELGHAFGYAHNNIPGDVMHRK